MTRPASRSARPANSSSRAATSEPPEVRPEPQELQPEPPELHPEPPELSKLALEPESCSCQQLASNLSVHRSVLDGDLAESIAAMLRLQPRKWELCLASLGRVQKQEGGSPAHARVCARMGSRTSCVARRRKNAKFATPGAPTLAKSRFSGAGNESGDGTLPLVGRPRCLRQRGRNPTPAGERGVRGDRLWTLERQANWMTLDFCLCLSRRS
jgi:hypothetical protein